MGRSELIHERPVPKHVTRRPRTERPSDFPPGNPSPLPHHPRRTFTAVSATLQVRTSHTSYQLVRGRSGVIAVVLEANWPHSPAPLGGTCSTYHEVLTRYYWQHTTKQTTPTATDANAYYRLRPTQLFATEDEFLFWPWSRLHPPRFPAPPLLRFPHSLR